jgi:hypothetical protein
MLLRFGLSAEWAIGLSGDRSTGGHAVNVPIAERLRTAQLPQPLRAFVVLSVKIS